MKHLLLPVVAALSLIGFACRSETNSPPPPTETGPETTDTSATVSSTDTATTGTTGTTGTMSTATTGTTSSSTPEQQLAAEIDRRFKRLNPGEMLINAPHQMELGVTERFRLRIASADEKQGIEQNLPATGQSATSVVHVTPIMRATLSGNGFTIEKTSPEEQIIGGGSFTEWLWQVTPIESGDRELVVNVQVMLDNKVKAIPATTWPVHVKPNVVRSAKLFIESNWHWLATTLIIPLVVFLWQQRKKRAV